MPKSMPKKYYFTHNDTLERYKNNKALGQKFCRNQFIK